MGTKRHILIGVTVAVLTGGATTAIAGTHTISEALTANIAGLPKGYSKINQATCKFATREVDVKPTPSEAYARAEDLRHDALDNCLRRRLNTFKVKAPKPVADPCWQQVGPPPAVVEHPDHGVNKPGDELGAAALSGWAAQLYTCEQAENAAS